MSRIILTAHPDGEKHIVVGWDPPCGSFFWQEFAEEPKNPESGEVDWEFTREGWEEVVRFAGYMFDELPTLEIFLGSLPEDLRPLMTDKVQENLMVHKTRQVTNLILDLTDDAEVSARAEERIAKMVAEAKDKGAI